MKPYRLIIATIMLIIVPVFTYAVVIMLQKRYEKLPVYDSSLNTNKEDNTKHFIHPFRLINQDAKSFLSDELKEKIYVADFFFTSCTSACVRMTINLKKVQAVYYNDVNVAFISFSVDPETDSAERLKWYANHFKINSANWNLLTGDKKNIYKIARESFYVNAGDGDGGATDFIHSDKLILVDKQQRIRGYYTGTDKNSVDQLIYDIKKLENEN